MSEKQPPTVYISEPSGNGVDYVYFVPPWEREREIRQWFGDCWREGIDAITALIDSKPVMVVSSAPNKIGRSTLFYERTGVLGLGSKVLLASSPGPEEQSLTAAHISSQKIRDVISNRYTLWAEGEVSLDASERVVLQAGVPSNIQKPAGSYVSEVGAVIASDARWLAITDEGLEPLPRADSVDARVGDSSSPACVALLSREGEQYLVYECGKTFIFPAYKLCVRTSFYDLFKFQGGQARLRHYKTQVGRHARASGGLGINDFAKMNLILEVNELPFDKLPEATRLATLDFITRGTQPLEIAVLGSFMRDYEIISQDVGSFAELIRNDKIPVQIAWGYTTWGTDKYLTLDVQGFSSRSAFWGALQAMEETDILLTSSDFDCFTDPHPAEYAGYDYFKHEVLRDTWKRRHGLLN